MKKERLMSSEIDLYLDSYNDIFSYFDPRPYLVRSLSSDFLDEMKRASEDKKGKIKLKFLLSKKKRRVNQEKIIEKRLKQHFGRHLDMLKLEKKESKKRGGLYVLAGLVFIFIATILWVELSTEDPTILFGFLIFLSEPAGWFLFWEGLGMFLWESEEIEPDLSFYEKMVYSDIQFLSLEKYKKK